MQSAVGKTKKWVLEYSNTGVKRPESLMGWTSSDSTAAQVKLYFDDQGAAISFAKNKGWTYLVAIAAQKNVKPRNYGDNFKYYPPADDKKT